MARGRIRLSGSGPDSSTWEPFKRTLSKLFAARTRDAVGKAVFKSFRVEGAPLKVRPALILLTILVLLLLSLLGFHPTLANRISPPVPFSDKLLHFVAFALASLTFYGVWVVDRTRMEWYWRWWNEGLSLGVCTVAGGIGSEWVQGLLPYKTFQWGDIVANLLGSLLGIYLARRLTLHYRQQAEIRRLYQPVHFGSSGLDSLPDDSDSDDDDEGLGGRGGAEAEMEEGRQRAEGALGLPGADESRRGTKRTARIEDNPWDDDAQSLFGVGEADDDDEEEHAGRRSR